MDNLPKLLGLFKDFVANFRGHILLVNHVLLIHITDNLSSNSLIPVDYILFETLCALQKGLRKSQNHCNTLLRLPFHSYTENLSV